jgi:glutamate:GABA antiporter
MPKSSEKNKKIKRYGYMKKVMGLWDIVFINITAIVAIRWLGFTAAFGAASIVLWIIAILMFFIPLGLISAELATTWPNQGGAYVWVSEAFGKRTGFIVSWFYWVNNFFYYPAVLTFIATLTMLFIDQKLMNSKIFICCFIIGLLWLSTLINIRGMRSFKLFSDLAGILGVLLPLAILIILSFSLVWLYKIPSATDYSWSNLLPNLNSKSNLASLAVLMFSMAGIELTPTMAEETKNPKKTFSRATFVSAIFIGCLYIASTVAITLILAPGKIQAVSGVADTLTVLGEKLHLPYLPIIVGGMIILGSLGSVGIWIIAPIKMLLESCKNGILPKWLTRTNKNNMPVKALLIQATAVTMIILCTALLPSLEAFFSTLVLMATMMQFIPYVFIFLAFIKLRKKYPKIIRPYQVPGKTITAYFITIIGLISVSLAITLPLLIPPDSLHTTLHIFFYRIGLVATPIIFAIVGYALYKPSITQYKKTI